jgi:hypothetical protein
MKRKLQIFVSSTYRDLLQERQAAVEAILRAGHIPAGMELFAAGDKSQLETIYRWIDESDIYMLILGSRYGSVEPDSGKSYTQLEYEYALLQGKRFFAVVLNDSAIDRKVKGHGRSVIEDEHPNELRDFKQVVTSKICRMVDDEKDIKLAIHETLLEFLREYTFDGWVSGKHLSGAEEMTQVVARLTKENEDLRSELRSLRGSKKAHSDSSFDPKELIRLLHGERETYSQEGKPPVQMSVLDWFLNHKNAFVTGISNKYDMTSLENFLFFRIAPHLSVHGLTEDQKVAGVRWRTIKTTKKGNDFLVELQKLLADIRVKQASTGEDAGKATPTTESPKTPSSTKAADGAAKRPPKKTAKARAK